MVASRPPCISFRAFGSKNGGLEATTTSDKRRNSEFLPNKVTVSSPDIDQLRKSAGGDGFVGSKSCATCHRQVYESWQATRHSYSLLTAEEAVRAGFPLPSPRRSGKLPAIRAWKDVSYVLGGRQRITYVDRSGSVSDTSYHHRIAKWNFFPPKQLSDCGPCHLTGFGSGPLHPEDPAIPGRWAERNIGCEACHGPGELHLKTYRKEDIVVDVSSRTCGACHTAVGRVLPKDDSHATHDLVQVWNRDPHANSVKSHSHSAFCSSCHSPYEGQLLDSQEGAERRVFAEEKHNISCIACHNPHDSTHGEYSRQRVTLSPALPPKPHVYRGHDQDFTTPDYKELKTTEQACVQCHRGADRIDLDHANASCNDCHNTFRRNRSLESRVFQDANHSGLSCRPCHRDADHLMTILFRDQDFLEAKHIHNLRTLPSAVYGKHVQKYPGLSLSRLPGPDEGRAIKPARPISADDADQRADRDVVSSPLVESLPEDLSKLLSGNHHRRLAADETVAKHLHALGEQPRSIARYLDLAKAYAQREAFGAVREVVEYAMRLDTPWILLDLPLDAGPAQTETDSTSEEGQSLARLFFPERFSSVEGARSWVQSYEQMSQGHFADAAANLRMLLNLGDSMVLRSYLGVAQLGQRSYPEAIETLEAVLLDAPEHLTARLALAVLHFKLGRYGDGRLALEKSLAGRPEDPVANYLLGRSYLRKGEPAKAAKALEVAVDSSPTFLEAWFTLARAYRLDRDPAAAAAAYGQIIARKPGQFHAHFELGGLFKQLGDRIAFRLRGDRESALPAGTSDRQWKHHLAALENELSGYGQMALSAYGTALRIRPFDFEAIRQISEIFRRTGRSDRSLEMLDWLSRRQGDRWIHYYRKGTILIELERYDEAIQLLKRALELRPTQGDVYFALGFASVRLGRLSEAIEVLQKGTIHEPFNPGFYLNLGAAHASRGNYQTADKLLRRSLELATFPLPRVHLSYTNLGLLQMKQGQIEGAVRDLKSALHQFPDYQYAQHLLDKATSSGVSVDLSDEPFVYSDLLEIFGEVSTVASEDE